MRTWIVAILLSGCLGGFLDDTKSIPDSWPESPQLQPGSQIFILEGDSVHQCTAGFLFRSSDNETLYLSLSAHCVGGVGDRAYDRMPGLTTKAIGKVAYNGWGANPDSIRHDFALVELSNGRVREGASPAVKHWEGPLGLADSDLAAPGLRVAAYGASGQRGTDHPDNPRLGRFVLNEFGELRVALDKKAVSGDSGGPLMTWDGLALGLLHGGPDAGIPVLAPNGLDVFTPVDFNLDLARSQGLDLELVTWHDYNGPSLPL